MKIAFLTNNPFKYGGQERVTSVIANALYKNGYDVSIICTDNKMIIDRSIYSLNDNINIIKLKEKKSNVLKRIIYKCLKMFNENIFEINNTVFLKKIYYLRDKKRVNEIIEIINDNLYDYVIGVSGKNSVLLSIIKEKINCKIFGWQHSCYEAYFFTKNKYYWHQHFLFEQQLKKLDAYIVLTNSDKNKVDNAFSINSTVINNPLSFTTNSTSNYNNNVFLSLGRIEEAKGYDLLLKSFKEYCRFDNKWVLKIVGDGSKKDLIIKLAIEYEINDRIIFLPFTSNVIEQMISADIFLFPSRWEGFGLVVTEAFECGLPVISYELDPVKEIITDNVDGILIEKFCIKSFTDAMLYLSQNKNELKKMGKNAKVKAEKYKAENIIKHWIQLFEYMRKDNNNEK